MRSFILFLTIALIIAVPGYGPGQTHNTVQVTFDDWMVPFQKWNIPSGGGVVRHMVTAPNGELLLAYSGVNKVGRVRIR